MAEEYTRSIDDWLDGVLRGEHDWSFSFQSDRLKMEYLASIEHRTHAEVSRLLLKFLIPSCSLGSDKLTFQWLVHLVRTKELRRFSQFQRRLVAYVRSIAKSSPENDVPPPWEGITWVLDLLPENPREAIGALDAYFMAHCGFMPDGRLSGLSDAIEVIRAKYIDRPRSPTDAIRLLLQESPRVFEHLVERLYSAMGYQTTITPSQKDGGYDILAVKEEQGRREKIHIECKRWKENIGVPILRGLFGVVADSKATKGVCIVTSDLTASAKAFVERNPQLDFVPGDILIRLLNEYLGPMWFFGIERLVRESKEETNINK
jgi:restriction system protein